MKTKLLIIALALCVAMPAAAQRKTISKSHEVRLSDLRLPQSEAGTVAFRTCDECPFLTKRVTAETRWLINGQSLPLAKFRAGIARITERRELYVTVQHHLEQDRVTKVAVFVYSDSDKDD